MTIKKWASMGLLSGALAILTACGGAPSDTTASSAASSAASPEASMAASMEASSAASTEASSAASASAAGDATGSEIPLYTGATPLDPNSPVGAAIDTIKQQLAGQQSGAAVTVDAYNLPNGTTFDQVKAFYNDELTGAGWTNASTEAQVPNTPGGGSTTWVKNDSEAVTIVVMPDPLTSGGALLMVAHAVPN